MKKNSHKLFLFIAVIVLAVFAFTNLSFFDGSNIIGINCGTVHVDYNENGYGLVAVLHDTRLSPVASCLKNDFAICFPSHAEFINWGIDTSTIQNLSVTSQDGKCIIRDMVKNMGLGQGDHVLTCTHIDTSAGLTLSCNNSQEVTVGYPVSPTSVQSTPSLPSGACAKANGCQRMSPGSGYRCDVTGKLNTMSGSHWCTCSTNCDVQIQ